MAGRPVNWPDEAWHEDYFPREGPCEIGICRANDVEVEAERLVFDHCHAHGWVRGPVCVPVCVPCNNRLIHIETGLGPDLPGWQRPALTAHLMKCPECREPPG